MTGLRWDGDARGEGVADARTFAPGDGGENRVVFEIVTGFPEGETGFAPHGHTVRIGVAGFR